MFFTIIIHFYTILQTLSSLRTHPDVDIMHFLSSRYGINVTKEEVKSTILRGLGGGESDEDCIDLMEMVAILMIPTLLKAKEQLKDYESSNDTVDDGVIDETEFIQPQRGLLNYVVSMILHDVTGSRTPKKLDRELLRSIFISYGETEMSQNNDLLDEMIAAAVGDLPESGQFLNEHTIAVALTRDVQLFDVRNEMHLTTNYFDVFKTNRHRTAKEIWSKERKEDIENNTLSEEEMEIETSRQKERPVKKVWTFPSIDFAAGNYRSKVLVICLWVSFILVSEEIVCILRKDFQKKIKLIFSIDFIFLLELHG